MECKIPRAIIDESRNEKKKERKEKERKKVGIKWIIGIKGIGIKKRSVEARGLVEKWDRNGERIEKVEIKRLFNL